MALAADPFAHLRWQSTARGWRALALLVCLLIGGSIAWARTVELDQFVTGEKAQVAALGEEMGEFLDIDIAL